MPGTLTEVYLRPLALTPARNPARPKEYDIPDLLMLIRKGPRFIDLRNDQPMNTSARIATRSTTWNQDTEAGRQRQFLARNGSVPGDSNSIAEASWGQREFIGYRFRATSERSDSFDGNRRAWFSRFLPAIMLKSGTRGTIDMRRQLEFSMADRSRWKARILFLAVSSLMLVDTFPAELPRPPRSQGRLAELLQWFGLIQGEWTMFAPNPSSRNVSLSAEITLANGAVVNWESPQWSDYGRGDRFQMARQVNYFDRVGNPGHGAALDDLASYLARCAEGRPEKYTEGRSPGAIGLGVFGPAGGGIDDAQRDDRLDGSTPGAEEKVLPEYDNDGGSDVAGRLQSVVSVKLFRQTMRILPPEDGQFLTSRNMQWSASSELVREWVVEP